jgi:predicted metalloprotease with PDZ domain
VSYYLKGGLIMMYLDWLIILATRGQKNLDHVMNELYHLYQKRPQEGITREEFFAIVERVSGQSFTGFVEKYIDGVAGIPWAQVFKSVGIHCTEKKEDKKNYLGLILTKKGEKVIVQNVAEDSPAFHSILQPLDEILALDNERLESEKNLDRHLRRRELKVLFSRRGKVSETVIPLLAKKQREISLSLMKKVNPTQKRARQIFLDR